MSQPCWSLRTGGLSRQWSLNTGFTVLLLCADSESENIPAKAADDAALSAKSDLEVG